MIKKMPKLNPEKMKNLDELCQDFSATQILYLIGEMLLREIEYDEKKEPNNFLFKMNNGRSIGVAVLDTTALS